MRSVRNLRTALMEMRPARGLVLPTLIVVGWFVFASDDAFAHCIEVDRIGLQNRGYTAEQIIELCGDYPDPHKRDCRAVRDRLREMVGNDGDLCAERCAQSGREPGGSALCTDRCKIQVKAAEAEIESNYGQCLEKKR